MEGPRVVEAQSAMQTRPHNHCETYNTSQHEYAYKLILRIESRFLQVVTDLYSHFYSSINDSVRILGILL